MSTCIPHIPYKPDSEVCFFFSSPTWLLCWVLLLYYLNYFNHLFPGLWLKFFILLQNNLSHVSANTLATLNHSPKQHRIIVQNQIKLIYCMRIQVRVALGRELWVMVVRGQEQLYWCALFFDAGEGYVSVINVWTFTELSQVCCRHFCTQTCLSSVKKLLIT